MIITLLFGAGAEVDRSGDQGTLRKGPVIPGYCSAPEKGTPVARWPTVCPGVRSLPLIALYRLEPKASSLFHWDVSCGSVAEEHLAWAKMFIIFVVTVSQVGAPSFAFSLPSDWHWRQITCIVVYQHSPPVFSAGRRISSPSPAEHLIRSLWILPPVMVGAVVKNSGSKQIIPPVIQSNRAFRRKHSASPFPLPRPKSQGSGTWEDLMGDEL